MKLKNIQYWIIPIMLITSAYFNNILHTKALLITTIAAIILGLFSVKKHRKNIDEIQIYVGTFIGLSFLSYIFSKTKNVGLDELVLELSAIIIFLALLNSRKWFKHFYVSIAALITIEGVWAIIQQLTRPETRSAGSFLSQITNVNYFPNALGLFFVMTIPIMWVTKKKKISIPNLAITGVGIIGLFLSFSRGAIIAFSISTLIILATFAMNKHYKKIIGLSLTLLISITLAFGITQIRQSQDLSTNDIAQKISFGGTESLTSVGERSDFLYGSLKIIKAKPLTGFGPNSFPYIYPQVQKTFLGNAPHPHNWILKIATERGLITLIPFILLVFTILIRSIASLKELKSGSRVNSVILLCALSTGFLHNMIDFNLNFALNLLIFFILTAAVIQRSAHKTINTKWNITMTFSVVLLVPLFILNTQHQLLLAQANNKDTNKAISSIEKSIIPYKDNYLKLSDLYIKENETALAKESLKKMTKANIYHAQAFNNLGLITTDPDDAIELYKKAVTYDPKNFFRYYVNYYKTIAENKDFSKFKESNSQIMQELKFYEELAAKNVHYTSKTQNITEAIILTKLFIRYGDRDTKSDFEEILISLIKSQKQYN
jgi:O-antigen ligase